MSRLILGFTRTLRIPAARLFIMGLPALVAVADTKNAESPQSHADRYRPVADRIIQTALAGNDAYRKLEHLCDDVGHRLSGSPQLDQAIQWAVKALTQDGHENVHTEPAMVPRWVRGVESCTMTAPRSEPLTLLGLGGSVGTPPEGLTAPVLAVRDEAELDALGDRARGKIILFDNPMPPYDPDRGAGYGTTVRFRGRGPRLAAEKGAVACLIRSVTAHSLRSPHTGATGYKDAPRQIPAAALSVEDAAMISRLQARGIEVVVTLKMEAKTLDPVESANVVAELRGSTQPDEVVVIGGHLDSWDVGQGAHDDGAGCVMAMEALTVLRKMDLRPRRTIRVVLWTNEENGLGGARAYAERHADELPKHAAAIEADSGGFRPVGYSVECADPDRQARAAKELADLTALLASIGATRVEAGGSGADLSPMKPAGVVLLGHDNDGRNYFDYHHSPADTFDKIDRDDLSKNVAALATMAYLLADMPGRLGDPEPVGTK